MKKAIFIFIIILVFLVVFKMYSASLEAKKQEDEAAAEKASEHQAEVQKAIVSSDRTLQTVWGNETFTSAEQTAVNAIAAAIIVDVKGSGGHMDKTALPQYEKAAALDLRKTWLLGKYLSQNAWFIKNGSIGDGNVSITKALNTQKWTAGTYVGTGQWTQAKRKERITKAINQLKLNLTSVGW